GASPGRADPCRSARDAGAVAGIAGGRDSGADRRAGGKTRAGVAGEGRAGGPADLRGSHDAETPRPPLTAPPTPHRNVSFLREQGRWPQVAHSLALLARSASPISTKLRNSSRTSLPNPGRTPGRAPCAACVWSSEPWHHSASVKSTHPLSSQSALRNR